MYFYFWSVFTEEIKLCLITTADEWKNMDIVFTQEMQMVIDIKANIHGSEKIWQRL
jgi:hypothetical protein